MDWTLQRFSFIELVAVIIMVCLKKKKEYSSHRLAPGEEY